eukprot:356454-Chlamydomonas_euryale.AAC.12
MLSNHAPSSRPFAHNSLNPAQHVLRRRACAALRACPRRVDDKRNDRRHVIHLATARNKLPRPRRPDRACRDRPRSTAARVARVAMRRAHERVGDRRRVVRAQLPRGCRRRDQLGQRWAGSRGCGCAAEHERRLRMLRRARPRAAAAAQTQPEPRVAAAPRTSAGAELRRGRLSGGGCAAAEALTQRARHDLRNLVVKDVVVQTVGREDNYVTRARVQQHHLRGRCETRVESVESVESASKAGVAGDSRRMTL